MARLILILMFVVVITSQLMVYYSNMQTDRVTSSLKEPQICLVYDPIPTPDNNSSLTFIPYNYYAKQCD